MLDACLVEIANTDYRLACVLKCVCQSWCRAVSVTCPKSLNMCTYPSRGRDVLLKALTAKPGNSRVEDIQCRIDAISGRTESAQLISVGLGVCYPNLQRLTLEFDGGVGAQSRLAYLPSCLKALNIDSGSAASLDLGLFDNSHASRS